MVKAEPVEASRMRAGAWSRYWATGARHSCVGSFEAHYGAATRAFWLRQFGMLTSGDRLLELGCGNGSLIRYLQECGASRWPARYCAIDGAQLDLGWLEDLMPEFLRRVDVHAATRAHRLPLADGVIHCIYSQYALEYFADAQTWSELERVMAPRVRVCAVVHMKGSHLHRVADAERGHCDWLLQPDGALDRFAGVLPFMVQAADSEAAAVVATNPHAAAAREGVNEAFARLELRARDQDFGDILHDAAQCVVVILREARAKGADSSLAALNVLREAVLDNRQRVADLVDCAMSRDQFDDWNARLKAAGFDTFELGEIRENGLPFGWSYVAQRSA